MTLKEIMHIESRMKDKEYFYFDCFDTIVYRKYSTKYVFYRMTNFLIQEYFVNLPFEELINSVQRFFVNCDIGIEDIATNIFLHYINTSDKELKEFIRTFKEVYIKAELDNIELAPNVKDLLTCLRDNEKKIYILSDYYLGKSDLEIIIYSLLDSFRFDEIFVSADVNKTKNTGGLYDCVINPKESIMIGDNEISDCVKSLERGIEAIRVDSTKQYFKYNQFSWKYEKTIYKHLKSLKENNKKFFCANYAFDLYAFCKKLYARLDKDDVVFFLARDGFFMKQCFDDYLKNKNYKEIKTNYLEVSRLALLMLSWDFEQNSASDFAFAFSSRTDWRIQSSGQLLMYLGFEKEEAEEMFGVKINNFVAREIDYFRTDEFDELYASQLFQKSIKTKQKEAMDKFSRLIGLYGEKRKIIIVDMGWKGTSQNDLRKILPNTIDLVGYYLGTTECIGEMQSSIKEGILFDYRNRLSVYDDSFHEIESLLKTEKGQLVCYKNAEDVYIEDNGVRVYNCFSKECQKKALKIFREIMEIDFVKPISYELLDAVSKDIKKKQSIKSLVWGRFYFDVQGNSDIKRTKPYFHNYKFALKMFLYRRFPFLYYYKRRYKN